MQLGKWQRKLLKHQMLTSEIMSAIESYSTRRMLLRKSRGDLCDFIGCININGNGVFLAAVVGKPTAKQRQFGRSVQSLGGLFTALRSVKAAEEFAIALNFL